MPPPSRQTEWPTARAARGKFYQVNDPVHHVDQLVVMLVDTWTDVGTILKKQEVTLKAQNGKIQELVAANKALAAQLNDAQIRLKNLRRARRKEMRADLEREHPELAAADREITNAVAPPAIPPITYL